MPTNGLSSPKALTFRPLNKGMILNQAPTDLPTGAFTRIMNYEVREGGLQRRGGFLEKTIRNFVRPISEAAGNGFSDDFRAMFNAFQSTDSAVTFIPGDNFLYSLTQKGGGSAGDLVMTRFSNRIPSWTLAPYNGFLTTFIERLTAGGDDYRVWIPTSLFGAVTPKEGDLLEIRPMTSHAVWNAQGVAEPFGTERQGWADATSWSSIRPNAPFPYSMWCRVSYAGNTKNINGISHYGLDIQDKSALRLLGDWNYQPYAGGGFTLAYLCDVGHEVTFYTDDLHPLQWTEALRITTAANPQVPAVYFTTPSWDNLHRLKPTEDVFTEVPIVPTGDSKGINGINCVQYHRGYLFVGNFYRDGIRRKNMLRWSSPVNCEDFAINDYLTFNANTEMVSLVSFGQYLVVFFGDAVYMGYPSNIAGMPFRFERLETGGVGLVNPRAWSIWADSLFFVGQNNVYRIGADAQIAPIGDAIANQVFYSANSQKKVSGIKLLCDVSNDRLVMAVPTENSPLIFTQYFSFCWKTKAWAQGSLESWQIPMDWSNLVTLGGFGSGLAYAALTGSQTYDDFDQTPDELPLGDVNRIDEQQGTIDSFNNRVDNARFWLLAGNRIFYYAHDSAYCAFSTHFPLYWETPDMDFEMAEQNKAVTEFGLKISTGTSYNLSSTDSHWSGPTPLTFRILVSRDRGGSWRTYGRLRIFPGKDEGFVTQLFLGGLLRFRVVCENRFDATIQDGVDIDGNPIVRANNMELPFTVLEFHVRARPAGREVSF